MLCNLDQFIHAIKLHFGPSQYEDLQGKLVELVQNSTIEAYRHEYNHSQTRLVYY